MRNSCTFIAPRMIIKLPLCSCVFHVTNRLPWQIGMIVCIGACCLPKHRLSKPNATLFAVMIGVVDLFCLQLVGFSRDSTQLVVSVCNQLRGSGTFHHNKKNATSCIQ